MAREIFWEITSENNSKEYVDLNSVGLGLQITTRLFKASVDIVLSYQCLSQQYNFLVQINLEEKVTFW